MKRKLTKADLEAREQMVENATELRASRERGQAELDRKKRDARAS